MQALKLSLLLLMTSSLSVNSETFENEPPCMNLLHSEEITVCLADTAKEKKEKYTKEYNTYLKSIETKEERPYDKDIISKLAKEAKDHWDAYLKKECLTEASIYEKGSNGYNDTYSLCLIDNYNQRIEYYSKNKF